jgi:uncharacterized protein (TIGR04255 family)
MWFLNDDGTELVQVQQDRFIRNWRKKEESDQYPRYHRLRDSFRKDFESFCQVAAEQQWGSVEPNQCELTYVNVIPAGEGWNYHGELEKVVTVFSARYSDDYLGIPEEVAVNVNYVLRDDAGNPIGRLRIGAIPIFRATDNLPAIRLTLTARGMPGDGVDGVYRFFDRGRESIVRGFTSITTDGMHKFWERNS